MSLIDKGHNAVADEIYREVVEEGREPTVGDVTVLAQEIVRLAKQIDGLTVEVN